MGPPLNVIIRATWDTQSPMLRSRERFSWIPRPGIEPGTLGRRVRMWVKCQTPYQLSHHSIHHSMILRHFGGWESRIRWILIVVSTIFRLVFPAYYVAHHVQHFPFFSSFTNWGYPVPPQFCREYGALQPILQRSARVALWEAPLLGDPCRESNYLDIWVIILEFNCNYSLNSWRFPFYRKATKKTDCECRGTTPLPKNRCR